MDYFANAVLAGVFVGVLSGLVGVLMILRNRSFFTVALTHATFPGGVVAAMFGLNIVIGAGVFGALLVVMMTALSRIPRQGKQVAAGIVLSFGYALGMFLVSISPWLPVKVETFLTGSILAIPTDNVVILGVTIAVVLGVYVVVGKELLFSSFDRRGFLAAGYREGVADAIALGLITVTVAVSVPAIGSVLAIAMLAAPAAAARLITDRILPMLAWASGLGVLAALLGLIASREWGLAAGGAIALAATAVYVLALAYRGVVNRIHGARQSASDRRGKLRAAARSERLRTVEREEVIR